MLINHTDINILVDTVWALSYLTDGGNEQENNIFQLNAFTCDVLHRCSLKREMSRCPNNSYDSCIIEYVGICVMCIPVHRIHPGEVKQMKELPFEEVIKLSNGIMCLSPCE